MEKESGMTEPRCAHPPKEIIIRDDDNEKVTGEEQEDDERVTFNGTQLSYNDAVTPAKSNLSRAPSTSESTTGANNSDPAEHPKSPRPSKAEAKRFTFEHVATYSSYGSGGDDARDATDETGGGPATNEYGYVAEVGDENERENDPSEQMPSDAERKKDIVGRSRSNRCDEDDGEGKTVTDRKGESDAAFVEVQHSEQKEATQVLLREEQSGKEKLDSNTLAVNQDKNAGSEVKDEAEHTTVVEQKETTTKGKDDEDSTDNPIVEQEVEGKGNTISEVFDHLREDQEIEKASVELVLSDGIGFEEEAEERRVADEEGEQNTEGKQEEDDGNEIEELESKSQEDKAEIEIPESKSQKEILGHKVSQEEPGSEAFSPPAEEEMLVKDLFTTTTESKDDDVYVEIASPENKDGFEEEESPTDALVSTKNSIWSAYCCSLDMEFIHDVEGLSNEAFSWINEKRLQHETEQNSPSEAGTDPDPDPDAEMDSPLSKDREPEEPPLLHQQREVPGELDLLEKVPEDPLSMQQQVHPTSSQLGKLPTVPEDRVLTTHRRASKDCSNPLQVDVDDEDSIMSETSDADHPTPTQSEQQEEEQEVGGVLDEVVFVAASGPDEDEEDGIEEAVAARQTTDRIEESRVDESYTGRISPREIEERDPNRWVTPISQSVLDYYELELAPSDEMENRSSALKKLRAQQNALNESLFRMRQLCGDCGGEEEYEEEVQEQHLTRTGSITDKYGCDSPICGHVFAFG